MLTLRFKEKWLFLSLSLFHVDEDSNGTIDYEELKKCLQKLQLHLLEEEIKDLFHSCDMDESKGIQFNEFIVLLCLIYLLKEPSSSNTVITIKLNINGCFISALERVPSSYLVIFFF